MNVPGKTEPLFEQIIARVPPEAAATFTSYQLEALKLASHQLKWKSHPLDIRLSIPFPGRGFYLVFLAGPERRSRQRLLKHKSRCSHQALAGIVASTLLLGSVVFLGISYLSQSALSSQESADIHPTIVPWIQDEAECQQSGRRWHNDHCWEKEWSHLF